MGLALCPLEKGLLCWGVGQGLCEQRHCQLLEQVSGTEAGPSVAAGVDVQVQLLRRQVWAQLGGMKCLVL